MADPPNLFPQIRRFNGPVGISYAVVLSLAAFLVLTVVMLLMYVFIKAGRCPWDTWDIETGMPARAQHGHSNVTDSNRNTENNGMDEVSLNKMEKMVYASSKMTDVSDTSCAICLSEYTDGVDIVRAMEVCGHIFHVDCVDPWLRIHATCPVCRGSPLPTPAATPLAEQAPPAMSGTTAHDTV